MSMLLTSCGSERGSREWLENRFGTELSRVYPTADLTDLFKEFPEGFKIHQMFYDDEIYFVELDLIGDKSSRQIEGNFSVTDLSVEQEKQIISIPVKYDNHGLVFDANKLKNYWWFDHLLLQELTIDKSLLSELNMVSKSYNFQNGDFEIFYKLDNDIIINYLKIPSDKAYNLKLAGSESNRGFYYSIIIRSGNDFKFKETISDLNN